ncbi:MAG: TusE/DsrC/DsvC family sulfur relay protein [Sulfuricella sp.]|nr:TusE/DsrC/DsvC family sulfur relay protein [Sulfuricella sp.]
MYDINQTLRDEDAFSNPDCHLPELAEWSEDLAKELAAKEDITMTPEHWEVVCFLREYYGECGELSDARKALHALEEMLGGTDARRRLFHLFPGGPVRQGCHIAGLPPFAHVCDQSFGTVH